MQFENMKVKQIKTIIYNKPDIMTWRAANRTDHIIGINITGKAKHDLGYKHLDLEPDYIYFFNQKDDYDAVTTEVGYCYSVHFTTYEPIETESFCKKVSNTEEIVKRIRKIEAEWLKSETGELTLLSGFYALCNMINQSYRASYAPKDHRAMTAREYIDLHFREKDCLACVVELSKLSQRRFGDIFKQHFGTTPGGYIISKKIDYAKQLLALGYLPVAEVAEMSGFSDVYYFSKMFKQEVGVAPGKFKSLQSGKQ